MDVWPGGTSGGAATDCEEVIHHTMDGVNVEFMDNIILKGGAAAATHPFVLSLYLSLLVLLAGGFNVPLCFYDLLVVIQGPAEDQPAVVR